MDAVKRIQEIEDQLSRLEKEREQLELQIASMKDDKWSEEGLRERLRKTILSRYGSVHNIKFVKLIMNGVYDDEYDNYENSVLIIVDKDFNDLKHDIDATQFCPSRAEQSDRYRNGGGDVCQEVILRFP